MKKKKLKEKFYKAIRFSTEEEVFNYVQKVHCCKLTKKWLGAICSQPMSVFDLDH